MSVEYSFADLLGRTIVVITGAEKDSGLVTIQCADGTVFEMFHRQDCCEDVSVEDVVGDPSCLIGHPITLAEETSNDDPNATMSGTWTFYRLGTVMGTVVIRWYGSSNGYYSESVDFVRVVPKELEKETHEKAD